MAIQQSKSTVYLSWFRRMLQVHCICVGLTCLFLFYCIQVFLVYPAIVTDDEPYRHGDLDGSDDSVLEIMTEYPLLVDWHDHFGFQETKLQTCHLTSGSHSCITTSNRSYTSTNLSQAIVFYGTDVSLSSLPLPRHPQHVWSLMHEESPKNNIIFSFKGIMELFNFTATFRRESHFPLTTQYLRSVEQLESTKFMKSFQEKTRLMKKEGLAPVIYVQSDCGVPSDRDNLVTMLMKHVKVDSYGQCLHNKDLPKHLVDPMNGMTHKDFLELVSKYKFAIAMENGICPDYITEKFWRPLVVGTIPIVLGSPSIKDFTPNNHSILDVTRYSSVMQLARDINETSSNEMKYNSYRAFKHTGGVTNSYLRNALTNRQWEPDMDVELNNNKVKPNFPDLYLCKVCEMMNSIRRHKTRYQATLNHYGCGWPTEFINENDLNARSSSTSFWNAIWKQTEEKVDKFLQSSQGGRVKPPDAKENNP